MTVTSGEGATPSGVGSGASPWEMIDDEDLIGTASARLLSTCGDRSDRLAALSLLGLLLDHADDAGRIRLPLDTLARELGVEPQRVVRLLQRLLAVEAVRTEGDAVVVVGSQPSGSLRPSRFLANLVTVLERQPSAPAPAQFRASVHKSRAMTPRSSSESKRRLVGTFAMALAAMALATVPSGDPRTALRSVAAPLTSSTAAPSAGEPAPRETPLTQPLANDQGPGAPDNAGPFEHRAPAASEDTTPTDSEPLGRGEATDDHGTAQPEIPRPRPDSAPPLTPSPGAEPDRMPPAAAPAPGPSEAAAPPDVALTCPSGTPEALVVTSGYLDVWPDSVLDLVDDRVIQVTGTVTNDSGETVTVHIIEVGIGEGIDRVVGSAGPVPLTVAAGESAGWQANLVVDQSFAAEPVVDVSVADWSWADPRLGDCPS